MPNLGRFTWFARHFSLASRNGHLSSTVQTDAILLAKHCWMLHVSSACSPCVACAWLLLGIDAQSLSLVTLVATCKRTQQFQTLLSQKLWELFASVLAVVCKRMQHFPTIMLGPALHFGKNTTHKTLKTTCNERTLPLSSWKSCANGSMRAFKIQRRGRQRERQKNNRFYKWNNNFARASRFFVHFFARYCMTTTWKCLISRFMEDIQ